MTLHRHLLLSIALCGGLMALVACSDDDESDATSTPEEASISTPPSPTSTPRTTSSASSTSTSAPTTTPPTSPPTTTPPTSPPTTTPGEPDWLAIVRERQATIDSLFANPDLSRFIECCDPQGPWVSEAGSAIVSMAERGERIVGLPPTNVISAELQGTIDDLPLAAAGLVLINVTIEAPDVSGAAIVDRDGNVVENLATDEEPGTPLSSVWSMVKSPEGRWLLLDILTA